MSSIVVEKGSCSYNSDYYRSLCITIFTYKETDFHDRHIEKYHEKSQMELSKILSPTCTVIKVLKTKLAIYEIMLVQFVWGIW